MSAKSPSVGGGGGPTCVLCACAASSGGGGGVLLCQGALHSFKSTKHFNTNNLTNLKNFLLLNSAQTNTAASFVVDTKFVSL